jgi:hypothetical protein
VKLNSITTERENVGAVESVIGFVTQFGSTSTSDWSRIKLTLKKVSPFQMPSGHSSPCTLTSFKELNS